MDGPAPDRPVARPHLLVAEDEPHIRRILGVLLEEDGFRVDVVPDGVEAMRRLEGPTPFDAILLDLLMPGLGGLEVLEQLRKLPRRAHTPVLILSAKGEDVDRERALDLGASDFLTKPFSPKKLANRIFEILRTG
jgi:two-component system, OmpR family, alkaline phosphatase synthesis response regulator PhoP